MTASYPLPLVMLLLYDSTFDALAIPPVEGKVKLINVPFWSLSMVLGLITTILFFPIGHCRR